MVVVRCIEQTRCDRCYRLGSMKRRAGRKEEAPEYPPIMPPITRGETLASLMSTVS